MVKKTFLVLILLFATLSFGADDYNKDIVVKNQSRNDKVKTVFREMMNAYEEEDIEQFFSFVSEDRFEQDYMTFYEAIDEDIRVYDILSIDTWADKLTDDGVKRYLYVQWEKRYLATSNDKEINQRGYSRFLFDEINGKYKLIQLAGNNFWGGSLPEWTEEVGDIAGQEPKKVASENLPDLTIINITCPGPSTSPLEFNIVNNGASVATGSIEYIFYEDGSSPYSESYSGNILAGQSVHIVTTGSVSCGSPYFKKVTVDPNDLIKELDENNNCSATSPSACP